ncbi:hypothetical protein DFQ30_007449 [Apophysomyces sp. BC1015]|nr:hypothetical protein DFQ30_007449 [Apophysomyces sp. BC1015]
MPLTAASLAELGQRKHQQRRQRCLGGRICVFIAFLAILLGGIAAFICWPRTPLVWMSGGAEAVNDPADWGPDTHPWLHATWQVNITLDNRQNWIPTHLTKLEFDIADSLTLRKFAWSKAGPLTLAPQTITPLRLVFDVNYDTSTLTDTTFQNLYHACGPQKMGTPPALNVVLHVAFHIFGIPWTPTVTVTPPTGGFLCPAN